MIGFGMPELTTIQLIVLAAWIFFFQRKKFSAILGTSILLGVLTLPHMNLMSDAFESNIPNTIFLAIIIGAGIFFLSVYGIIYSAIAMANNRKSK